MKRVTLLRPEDGSTTGPLSAHEVRPTSKPAKSCSAAYNPDEGPLPLDVAEPAVDFTVEDRSFPSPVVFEWRPPRGGSGTMEYRLLVSADDRFTELHARRNLSGHSCAVYNLRVGTRYFWKVVAGNASGCVAESEAWSFSTHEVPPRWIYVPGITNVRDMGGWTLPGKRRIRQGLVYRSSELNSHVDISEEGKRVLLEDLRIRTDLDLRGSGENPVPVLDRSAVRWVNIPVAGYGGIIKDQVREAYKKIFKLFAQPSSYPIIFHCWGGADRGGTLAFLLQALLGMRDRDKIRDYELTSLSIWGERDHRSPEFQALGEVLRPFGGHKDKDEMNGQVENYLVSIGVTTPDINAIRKLLIEKR